MAAYCSTVFVSSSPNCGVSSPVAMKPLQCQEQIVVNTLLCMISCAYCALVIYWLNLAW